MKRQKARATLEVVNRGNEGAGLTEIVMLTIEGEDGTDLRKAVFEMSKDGLTDLLVGSDPDVYSNVEYRIWRSEPEDQSGNSWEDIAEHLLSGTPDHLRVMVREGGGHEDLKASLATTFIKMRGAALGGGVAAHTEVLTDELKG